MPIITNCYWLPQSAFYNMIPTDVNNYFIKYNNSLINVNDDHNKLCACNDQNVSDCSINDLGYLYPGETLTIFLHHEIIRSNHYATKVTVKGDISKSYTRPCLVLNFYEQSQLIIDNYCSELNYRSLNFAYDDWCELFLTVAGVYNKRFYIRKLISPPGFVEINNICVCGPMIVSYGITKCDINNQTVLRPGNT